jgi:hypothetical protein
MKDNLDTRLSLQELTSKTIMDKLDEFQIDNKEQHQAITRALENFELKLDKALEGKANVWVEKAFSWLLYSIGGIIVAALMYTILKTKI